MRSPGIGLLFLVLRLDETLRVNVRAAADLAGGAGSQQTMIHLDVRVTPSGGYSQGVFSEERKASSSWMTR